MDYAQTATFGRVDVRLTGKLLIEFSLWLFKNVTQDVKHLLCKSLDHFQAVFYVFLRFRPAIV